MARSLLDELPSIVSAGKRQAAQVLESLEGRYRVTLQTRELVIPAKDTSTPDLFRSTRNNDDFAAASRLIYGDNLLTMAALLAGDEQFESLRGKIDLIYIDPPFDSKADYRTRITLPGTTIDQKPTVLEQFAYSDTWADGTASYLAMITPRMILMRALLSDEGSIYVHIDDNVGSYVRIVLDEVFGRDCFRGEIIWQLGTGAKSRKYFSNQHNTLYCYSKTATSWYFNKDSKELREPFAAGSLQTHFRNVDAAGRRYRVRTVNGKDYVYYADEGRMLGSVWTDISSMSANSPILGETLEYPTQKPAKLLRRLIEASCPPGGLVADFFVGSGTAAAVAERLGRRWVVADIGKPAVMITRKRLIDQDAKPFVYQAIGDYQVEQVRSTLGRRFRVGELSQVVLSLFGALPLPPEENVNGSLGRLRNARTLVYADSPTKLTTMSTLRRAQGYRDAKLGGFDRVVVLGWNFSAGIGQDIANLNDPDLEVLVIPPDLLDRLRKKGPDRLASAIRFSSLQYLEVGSAERKGSDETEELRVRLSNYVLLSPDAINLDDDNRARLQRIMNNEPLALIEYWAVDPDYDGEVFRSVWQDYRGNTDNDEDPLRVVTEALLNLPARDGPRTICVRAVDVFGFESEVVVGGLEVTP